MCGIREVTLLCSCIVFVNCNPLSGIFLVQNSAVSKFREYIQIDTSVEENLKQAVEFWEHQAEELGLHFNVYAPGGLPICVIKWEGRKPDLPSIVLNSHMDVVGVEPEEWTYPPFAAEIDPEGNLYGRGTQDTKDIAIQYIEAVRQLMDSNVTLDRTVYITLMPDEETGGFRGMQPFLQSQEFTNMNVGVFLDEGLASSDDKMFVGYQDKRPWQMKYTVHGVGGHGSSLSSDTAMQKAQILIDTIMQFRNECLAVMDTKNATDFGGYTVVNINMVQGGIATNVIPAKINVVVDMRLATSANITEYTNMVNSWAMEAGNDTEFSFIRQQFEAPATAVDHTNPYWIAMNRALADMGIETVPIVIPATTDMNVVRPLGIPAFGFAPKTYTTSRIHGSNEYLNIETFLKGIDVYANIIQKMGNF